MDSENYILKQISYWERRLANYRSRFHDSEGAVADFKRQDKYRQRDYDMHYKSNIARRNRMRY